MRGSDRSERMVTRFVGLVSTGDKGSLLLRETGRLEPPPLDSVRWSVVPLPMADLEGSWSAMG